MTASETVGDTRPEGSPPTTSGFPRNAGFSRTSTEAKKASMSRWMIFLPLPPLPLRAAGREMEAAGAAVAAEEVVAGVVGGGCWW